MDFNKLSEESLNEMKEQIDLALKNKNKDYTVDGYEKVIFNENYRNLIFGNDCRIGSNYSGDGINVDLVYIDAIVKQDDIVILLLKGHDRALSDYEVLWKNEE